MTLSTIRAKNREAFEKRLACNKKHKVPNPLSCPICFLRVGAIGLLSTSETNLLEGIKEWARSKKRDRDHKNIPDDMERRVTDYQNGFDDVLSDLLTFINEGLKI